jgi:hypothetical protein
MLPQAGSPSLSDGLRPHFSYFHSGFGVVVEPASYSL